MIDTRGIDRKISDLKELSSSLSLHLESMLEDVNWVNRTGLARDSLEVVFRIDDDSISFNITGDAPYQGYLEARDPHITPTSEEFVLDFKRQVSSLLDR